MYKGKRKIIISERWIMMRGEEKLFDGNGNEDGKIPQIIA